MFFSNVFKLVIYAWRYQNGKEEESGKKEKEKIA